jgi:hypothetical protein
MVLICGKNRMGFMMHTLRFTNSIVRSLVYGTRTRHADELNENTVMFGKRLEWEGCSRCFHENR